MDDRNTHGGDRSAAGRPQARSVFTDELRRAVEEAGQLLERIRRGEAQALVEIRQFWERLRAEGNAHGVPGVVVLSSALAGLSEAWQRARLAGREHADAPRLAQEAVDLLPALARGEVPRGSGVLKDLCVRAAELTQSLARAAAEARE